MSWKEEFKKEYFSADFRDIDKAMLTKKINMPSKLYRYRSLNNEQRFIDEVLERRIFMSNPKEFNDPFDSSSILKVEDISKSEKLKNIFEEWVSRFSDRSIVRSIFKHKNWFERLNGFTANLIEYENEFTGSCVEEKERWVKQYYYGEFERLNEHINRLSTSFSKVACFTESNTNLPMWAHYTNGHKGVCLEYDFPKILKSTFVDRMFPVFYVNELPNGISLVLDSGINRVSSSDYLLLHKLNDWNYEKEWRLVLDASFWYTNLKNIPKEFYEEGKIIDFIRPSKIYLGYKVAEDKEEFVREIGKRCGIPVVKMQCTNYGLKPEDEF